MSGSDGAVEQGRAQRRHQPRHPRRDHRRPAVALDGLRDGAANRIGASVDGDAVHVGVDQEARWRRVLAVHAHSSGGNQLVGRATAGDAGPRQEAVQAFLVAARPLDGVLASVRSRSIRGVGRWSSDSRPKT